MAETMSDFRSWWNRYPCVNCGCNVVVTQAIKQDCDYWYYCSNKTCSNHEPGEQLGDMEDCSFAPYHTTVN